MESLFQVYRTFAYIYNIYIYGDLHYEVSRHKIKKNGEKIAAQNVEVIFAVTYVMIFKHSGL